MASQDQLNIETQINKALRERLALAEKAKASLASQVAIAQELCRALECKELDGFNERIAETQSGLLKASEASNKAKEASVGMGAEMKKAGKKAGIMKGVAVGAAIAIKNAFGLAKKVISSLGAVLVGLVKGGFNLVRNAMAAYTGMLGFMAKKSREGADASIGFRNSIEDLKEQFGALDSGIGNLVQKQFEAFRSSGDSVAGTGIRLSKIFGRGPDGLAALNAFLGEQMSGLGANLDRLGPQFAEAADEALILNKALGFQGEDFERLGLIAGHAGETLKETFGRLSREIVTVTKRFNVNSRVMAKNISIMMKSPAVFGTNTKEMIKTSVAAQKLGLSIEELQGPMSVFDDFESGAKAAAMLASEFGIFVDSAAMMSMEPAQQAMHLKEALAKSGKEYASMSRQERQLLAEQMGMTDDALMKMMDPSNTFDQDGMNEMEDGVDAATQATLTQTQAIKELSKAIKQMNETGQSINTEGGFFGAFKHGVAMGLMNSKEMRGMMRDVEKGFRAMYYAGIDVGHMLGELFQPGAPLGFLAEHFELIGKNAEEMADKVRGAFRRFVDTLKSDNPEEALLNLFEDLGSIIGGPQGVEGLAKGFGKLFDIIGANIITAAPFIMEKLIGLFEAITAMLTGDAEAYGNLLGDKAIMPMTMEAFAKLRDSGIVDEFGNAFMDMMTAFWDKFGGPITDFLGYVIYGILAAAFMQSIPLLLAGGVLKGVSNAIMGGVGKILGTGSTTMTVEGSGNKYFTKVKGIGEQIKVVLQTFADMSLTEIAKAGLVIAALGAGFAASLYMLSFAVKKLLDTGATAPELFAVAGIIYALGGALWVMYRIVEGMSSDYTKITKKGMTKAAVLIGASLVVFGAVALIMSFLVKDFIKMTRQLSDPKKLGSLVESGGKLTMTVVKATAAIVAMGGALALLAATGPIGMAIIAAALIAATGVFYAVAEVIKELIYNFAEVPLDTALRAKEASIAAMNIVEVVLKTLDQMERIIAVNVLNPGVFDESLDDMVEMIDSLANKMMPAVNNAAAMMTENPEEIRDKFDVIVNLMKAMNPIADLMAAAVSIQEMRPEDVAMVVAEISSGIGTMMNNMTGFITSLLGLTDGISASEIEAAKGVAPMIGAVAELVEAFTSMPTFKQETRVVKGRKQEAGLEIKQKPVLYGLFNVPVMEHRAAFQEADTTEDVGPTQRQQQKNRIKFMVDLINDVAEPLKNLMTTLMKTNFEGMTSAQVKTKAEALGAMMSMVKTFAETLKILSGDDIPNLVTREGANKVKLLIGRIADIFIGQFRASTGTYHNIVSALMPAVQNVGKLSAGLMNKGKDGAVNLGNFMRAMPNLFKAIGGVAIEDVAIFGTKLIDITTQLDLIKGKVHRAAFQPLFDVVRVFNELGEELSSSAKIVNISGVLKGVADALKIEDESVTVERGNIKMTVNLNVVMKADDVAETLVQGGYVVKGDKYDQLVDLTD